MDCIVPQQYWTGVTPCGLPFAQTTYDQGYLPSKREIVSPFTTEDNCLYKLKDEADNSADISFEQTLNDGVLSDCDKDGRCCVVCGEKASGYYFGALVCLPCKSFYIRCTKDGEPAFTCQCNGNCDIAKQGRIRCQYCRYRRCLMAGMCRKEKPETVQPAEGQVLCKVCGDIANGVHFGVNTCEGCKKFFRRGLMENVSYMCKGNKECSINPRNRNNCRYCRYQKCLQSGMSREAIKMGRPKKCEVNDCISDNSNKRPLRSPGGRFGSPQPETVFFDHMSASPVTDYSSACSSPRDTSDTELNSHMRDNEDHHLHKRSKPIDIKTEDVWECHTNNCMSGHLYANQFPSCKHESFSPSIKSPKCSADSCLSGEWNSPNIDVCQASHDFYNRSYQTGSMPSCSYQPNSPTYDSGVSATSQTTLHGGNNQTTGFSNQAFNPRKRTYDQVEQYDMNCIIDYLKTNESGTSCPTFNSCSVRRPIYQVPSTEEYSMGNTFNESTSCSPRSYECGSGYSSPGSSMSISPSHSQESSPDFHPIPVYGPYNFASQPECNIIKSSGYKWVSNQRSSVLNIQLIDKLNNDFINATNGKHAFDDVTFQTNGQCIEATLERTLDKAVASALLQTTASCRNVTLSHSYFSGYSTVDALPLDGQYKESVAAFPNSRNDCCIPGSNGFQCESYSQLLTQSYWSHHPQTGLVNSDDSNAIVNQILNAYTMYTDGCNNLSTSRNQNMMLDGTAQTVSMHANVFVKFVSSIPGFCELHPMDKMLLTGHGAIQCGLLMAMVEYYDDVLKTFPHWLDNLMQSSDSLYQLRLCLTRLGEQIHSLNLDKVETAMLCALMVTSSDWLTLVDKNTIQLLRNRLMSAFQAYMSGKCMDPMRRMTALFAIVPNLRHIGMWYKQVMKNIRMTSEENCLQSCADPMYSTDYTMPCTTLRCG